MKIEMGETVVAVLNSPREKLLGILDEISPAGIYLRGIDLSYFDDWCNSIAAGEPYLPMADQFIPLWRIEKLTRDEDSPEVPSMNRQFEARTGRALGEF